jgi:hypothetical protein
MKPADLTDPRGIPAQVLREALQDSTRGKIGKDFELALRRFANTHPNFKGLRRSPCTASAAPSPTGWLMAEGRTTQDSSVD